MNSYHFWFTDGKRSEIKSDRTLIELANLIEINAVKIFGNTIVNFKYVTSIHKYESK